MIKGIVALILFIAIGVALSGEGLLKAIAELVAFVSLVVLVFLNKKSNRTTVKFDAEEL
ncbi:hypothetical protein RCJ22_11255 [Vibrio sp. FNV 38]|nr:hypothetical protein [Vibrio sp. FNV 38]